MSYQAGLLDVSSYQDTRKAVKGRRVVASQLDLFGLKPKSPKVAVSMPQKGKRYLVKETGQSVVYIGRMGAVTLWESQGVTWRATRQQIEAVSLIPFH